MDTNKPIQGTIENQTVQRSNPKVRRNNIIFAILMILFQIAAGIIYGILMRHENFIVSNNATTQQTVAGPLFADFSQPLSFYVDLSNTVPLFNGVFYTALHQVFITVCYAIFVIAGFGLLISYLKMMVWSGIGFTLLITAFTIEYYFMMNAAFGWAQIEQGNTRNVGPQFYQETPDNLDYYYFALTSLSGGKFGNYLLQAFKASLANVVAFSAIIGRAGPLEAWIIVFVGTVGYQLVRVLITRFAFDGPGTTHIFIYGGFFGLIVSFLLKFREPETAKHPLYTANKFSSTMAILGTIICWIFFPLLAMDPAFTDATSTTNLFTIYTGPINVVFGLTAATICSFAASSLINGKLQIRDIVYGPIAGGIATLTASVYIIQPVFALLAGSIAGLIQVFGMNLFESKWARSKNIIHSTSFFLFAVQGVFGSVMSSMNNSIIHGRTQGFFYIWSQEVTNYIGLQNQWFDFLMGLMTIGIGLVFGLGAAIFILCFASHERQDHFTDNTYWVDDDGISYPGQAKVVVPPPVAPIGNNVEMEFYEGEGDIKNVHAYL